MTPSETPEHRHVDALVRDDPLVELEHHPVPLVLRVRVDDAAAAKHVVDHRQPPGPQQAQGLLVVVEVADLVGVDEREVERLVGGHRAQRVERRAEAKIDPLGQPRLVEVAARDARPLLADVAGDEQAVVGQPAGDADRRVAGEGAELERPAGADRAHQQVHERPLLGGDLHDRDPAKLGGLGGEPPQQLVLAGAVLDQVARAAPGSGP